MKRFNKTPDFSFTYISGDEHIGHYTETGYLTRNINHLKEIGAGILITEEILNSNTVYLCPINQNGKIGFINSFADVIIEPQYDSFMGNFTSPDSLIIVSKNSKWRVLKANGLEILMDEFQSISLIDTQYAIVMDSEYKKGIIETMTKRIVIALGEYDNFSYYSNLLIAHKKQLNGLITPTGELITPIKYKWISNVEYGLLRVIIEENNSGQIIKKWGLIDTQGNEVLPVIYDRISSIRNDGQTVYADKDGKNIKFNIKNLITK